MDIFREVKERVPMEEAARRYGFEVDRSRRILCPFHNDSRPSLQLYKNGRGWWCYVCDMGGSVIDFVAKLYSLTPKEAAQKLNEDFSLGLPMGPGSRTRGLERRGRNHALIAKKIAQDEKRREYDQNQQAYIALREELDKTPPGGRRGEIMGRMSALDYWFETHPFK